MASDYQKKAQEYDDIYNGLIGQSSSAGKEKADPELLPYFSRAITAVEKEVDGINTHNWRKALKQENILIDQVMKIDQTEPTGISWATKKAQDKNKFYLSHDIKPDSSVYGVSALYFMRQISPFVFSVYGFLFFVFLFYDLFIREVERNNKSWLKTLPFLYQKIELSKLIVGLLLMIITTFVVILAAFLTGLVLTGHLGSLNYPMKFTYRGSTLASLPFYQYCLLSWMLLFVGVFIFLLIVLGLSKLRLKSEKVLLVGVIGSVVISQVSKMLRTYSFINSQDTVIKIFKHNSVNQAFVILGGVSLLIILILLLSRKLLESKKPAKSIKI
ncbi:hypothetical protein KIMC2_16820 [Xylocopilactobacillus apis]|uniref:ABC transporter permease n=2 Tax=Xylocopilactobacillus apis TaxID=2932183 RepID=A0AAU9DBH4_9LACO|nr:hypothetical protein KIMC2_16820 [Xylocopilactobacillus apis]